MKRAQSHYYFSKDEDGNVVVNAVRRKRKGAERYLELIEANYNYCESLDIDEVNAVFFHKRLQYFLPYFFEYSKDDKKFVLRYGVGDEDTQEAEDLINEHYAFWLLIKNNGEMSGAHSGEANP